MSVRDRLDVEVSDTVLIVGALFGVYAVYLLAGTVLGYSLRGQVNSIARLTFLIGVYGMMALALNLHWGYTGLFNIGIAGFMAVGLYTMAIVSKPPASATAGAAAVSGLGLPLWVGVLAGMAAAAILGLLVALPALRLRADYLAIVTIATSEIVRFFFLSGEFQTFTVPGSVTVFGVTVGLPWNPVELGTGGGRGLILNYQDPMEVVFQTGPYEALIDALDPLMGGSVKPVVDSLAYAVVLLAVVAAFYWLLKRTGESPFGRVLKAIREDEDVANALGKNTDQFKIKSFMLGCALMGLGGILWQLRQGAITPTAFRPQVTFFIWLALIIGGAGSNTGSVLGAIIFAGFLFQGPLYLKNIVRQVYGVAGGPNTFAGAVGPLLDGNLEPLLAYTIGNINALQLVIMGLVLIWLMQHRPEGMLGHRKEEAATIPLRQTREERPAAPAADGGTEGGGKR